MNVKKPENVKVTISVRITKDVEKTIEDRSNQTGRTPSRIVEDALLLYLQEAEENRMREAFSLRSRMGVRPSKRSSVTLGVGRMLGINTDKNEPLTNKPEAATQFPEPTTHEILKGTILGRDDPQPTHNASRRINGPARFPHHLVPPSAAAA